jgi:hypothetical protein
MKPMQNIPDFLFIEIRYFGYSSIAQALNRTLDGFQDNI